jgi:broad specificity phosphatase PhoE/predicted kinase
MPDRLVIALVGLPARGKSTMARKLQQALSLDGMRVRIFNNGALRRRLSGEETSCADFFSPRNAEGVRLREQFARMNLDLAAAFLGEGGQAAIIDAANVSRQRRRAIEATFGEIPVLFVECFNEDAEVLEATLRRKAVLDEFRHLSPEAAITSFRERISHYESMYETLQDERNQVLVNSFEARILREALLDLVPHYDRIRDLIVTRLVKNLFLVRHGETTFNLEDRIGGDPELTARGWAQAEAMAEHFSQDQIPLVFTSALKRAQQTAIPIARRQQGCTIIPLVEFNEIRSGICDEMSYREIQEQMPELARARKRDKYSYVYPQGESYATMEERIERGIRKVFYLGEPDDNIMIVGHRAVNRMILSYFVYRQKEEVPYIFMPQASYYHIQITPHKRSFELKPWGNSKPNR